MPEIDRMKAGICLSFLGGLFLLFFVVWLLHRTDSRPAYKKRLPKLTSRYKDYETALYVYASDGTKTQKEFFKKIIQAEASRYRRLPKKEDGM